MSSDLSTPGSLATLRFSGQIDGNQRGIEGITSHDVEANIALAGAFSNSVLLTFNSRNGNLGFLVTPNRTEACGSFSAGCLMRYSFEIDLPLNTYFYVKANYAVFATTGSHYQGSSFASAAGVNDGGLTLNMEVLTPDIVLTSLSGHDYSSAAPIPEPSTWALMAVGLLVLGASSARRSKTPALNAAA